MKVAVRQGLLWGALVLAVVSAAGGGYYFSLPAELRWPAYEGLWVAMPSVVLFVSLMALVVREKRIDGTPQDK